MLITEAAVDGVHGDALIDTGDHSSFTVFRPFASANGFYTLLRSTRDVATGIGIGGVIYGDVFSTTIDAFGFSNADVPTRAPVGVSGAFDSAEEIGGIGNGLLRRYHLVFDGVHQTIAAWPAHAMTAHESPDAQAEALPRHGTFGAAFGRANGGALVTTAISGGAAAEAGVLAGDLIVALGDVPIRNTADFLATIHRFHAGDRTTIVLIRANAHQTHSVTLGTPAMERDAGLTTEYDTVVVDGTLRRTLVTYPANATGRLPALLILGGIGCYSVDVASNAQDSYLRLAHDVSRAGFVTMRIEKSGIGDSEGPPCAQVDFAAEQRGYAAAFQALRNSPHVDPSRIYLFGHSIGTLEAPLLANTAPVAGVVVAEAVGRDWPDYELRNTRRQLELGGETPSNVDAAMVGKDECLVRLLLERQPETEIERDEPDCKIHNGVYPVDPPYMQQVARVNAIAEWAKIGVPVLAIYGTSDFVTEEADHRRIVDVVNAHHAGVAQFEQIEGMDHLLDVAATPKDALAAFSSGAPRQYDASLSSDVIEWLDHDQSRFSHK